MFKRTGIYLVLAWICSVVVLLVLDAVILNGILLRDFMSLFVHKDMEIETISMLLGMPQRDVGSGITILEWDMPMGAHYYVGYLDGVTQCWYEPNNASVQGVLLPLLCVLLAVVETVCCAVFCGVRRLLRRVDSTKN